ncbi:hypothetical protein E4U13_001413 [Claviceps humidiphila]|uniref:Uncharacterized protein n=1 Tax=Claviceps humidiphila TaxID=1294629 RepID=A0A9P7Q1J2_9HYPO|nr:hypothetical protein E4U13_001413 [Claviceps humidiphila]
MFDFVLSHSPILYQGNSEDQQVTHQRSARNKASLIICPAFASDSSFEFVKFFQQAQEAGQEMNPHSPETNLTPVRIRGKRQRSLSIAPKLAMNNPWNSGFHETWDEHFGLSKTESSVLLTNKGETAESDEALQSALLSLPWVDIDFILQAQQSWADKHARGRCYHHYYQQEVIGSFEGDSPEEQKFKQHILQHEEGTLKFDARACFEADYVRAHFLITAPGSGFLGRQWGTMDILPKVRIPMDLITGPWDEEKKRRLYWLTRARYCVDGEPFNLIPYPWEVKLACLDAVLIHAEKPDRLVINCLIGPWIFTDLPQDEVHKRILSLCRRLVQAEGPSDIGHFVGEVIKRLDTDGQFPDYHIDRLLW